MRRHKFSGVVVICGSRVVNGGAKVLVCCGRYGLGQCFGHILSLVVRRNSACGYGWCKLIWAGVFWDSGEAKGVLFSRVGSGGVNARSGGGCKCAGSAGDKVAERSELSGRRRPRDGRFRVGRLIGRACWAVVVGGGGFGLCGALGFSIELDVGLVWQFAAWDAWLGSRRRCIVEGVGFGVKLVACCQCFCFLDYMLLCSFDDFCVLACYDFCAFAFE